MPVLYSNGRMTVAGGVPGGLVREGEPASFTNQFKMFIVGLLRPKTPTRSYVIFDRC